MSKIATKIIIEGEPKIGEFFVQKHSTVVVDGLEFSRIDRFRAEPGDFAGVERFAPEITPLVKQAWTEPVIAFHKAKMAAQMVGPASVLQDTEAIKDLAVL